MDKTINQKLALVPVLSINGFLGSGKTTLVNHLLRHAEGRKIVVYINDFGALNIDYDLVETQEANRISLKNGCVCCSLNDDLIRSISEMVKEETPPDAIVIESSGVSDPRALDSSLETLEKAGLIRLDTKLYVVDAENYEHLDFDDAELVIDYAANSDIILINKSDIVHNDQLSTVHDLFRSVAPYSNIIDTTQCDISTDLIFGFDHIPIKRTHNQSLLKKNVNHSKRFHSHSLSTNQLIDREKFEQFAKNLPKSCLRAKAILQFSDKPDRYQIFNLVGYRANLESRVLSNKMTQSQFVAIGFTKKFNSSEIEQGFLNTLSTMA